MLIMWSQQEQVAKITVTVEESVASYLNNRKRRELVALEEEYGLVVVVQSREDLPPEYLSVVCHNAAGHEIHSNID